MAEEARRRAGEAARAFGTKADQVFGDVKRKAVEFKDKNDVEGKVCIIKIQTFCKCITEI